MEYGDEGWSGRDGVRRSFRDTSRDIFFNAFGGERVDDPFLMNIDPRQQLQLVMGLIEQAGVFHSDDNTALPMLKQMIAGLGFGAVDAPTEEKALAFGNTRVFSLLEYFAG